MRGQHFINGVWLDGQASADFESVSPANRDERIGTFRSGTAKDIVAAVQAAGEAYPAWRSLSRIKRAEFFNRFAELTTRDLDEIAQLLSWEAGKQINEARADVIEGIHMAQYVFGASRMPHGDVICSEIPEKDLFMRRRSKGVIGVITPWNFPFAVPMWLIGPAVSEGNTVVFKPSEETPAVGEKLMELLNEAGFPPGVINLVQGTGETAGDALVRHPDVKVLLFTGSYDVGHHIKRVSADLPDRMCVCEMGSKSAVIVFDDARMDIALNASVLSAFKTSGQRCVSAGRLLVQRGVVDEFADRFVRAARAVTIGDPRDDKTFMGPLINEAAVEKVGRYNALAKEEGVDVLLDGGRLMDAPYDKGGFMSPFVYRVEHRPDIRCIHEEVFGPHVAIVPFDDLDHAIEIYNDTDYGLSCAVITEDYRKMREIRERCDFGLGYANLPCIGAEVHLPFGGVKKSGVGLPSASALIDAVTHRYAWTVNHDTRIQMPQGMSAEIPGA